MKYQNLVIKVVSLFIIVTMSIILYNKYHIEDRSKIDEYLTSDEELYIYEKIMYLNYIEENKQNLSEINLDVNKPLKGQVNKVTGEDFEYFFKDKAKKYRKNINMLMASKYRKCFGSKRTLIDKKIMEFTKMKKISSNEKLNRKRENVAIKEMFEINDKKVYTIFNRIIISDLILKERINVANKENMLISCINNKNLNFYKYKYNMLYFDNINKAKEIYYTLDRGETFNEAYNKYISNYKNLALSTDINIDYSKDEFIDNRNIKIALWLANSERKKGDIAIIKSDGKYFVLQFLDKYNVLDKTLNLKDIKVYKKVKENIDINKLLEM